MITDVVEVQWGQFCPMDLAESNSAADKRIACDKLLSMIFLAGVDKNRYGKLLEDLNNSYLSQKDNYPSNIDSTLTLLSNYQDHKTILKVDDNGNKILGHNYAQQIDKHWIRCYKCNEYGHVQKDCPKKEQNIQLDNETNEEEEDQHTNRPRQRIGWHGGRI